MKPYLILLIATLISSTAWADEPSKNTCAKPVIPAPMASDLVMKYFRKHLKEFNDCTTKYVDGQQAIEKSATDKTVAAAAHDAAEAAIEDHNKFIEELNIRNEKASAGASDDDK